MNYKNNFFDIQPSRLHQGCKYLVPKNHRLHKVISRIPLLTKYNQATIICSPALNDLWILNTYNINCNLLSREM